MNFRSFFKRDVVVEDMPVSGEYGEWYPSLRTGVSARSQANDVYLFKDIADALNITVQTAVDLVSQRLFDRLFPNNQPNPANTEDEFRDAIFNALTEIVDEINQQAGTNIKNSKSQKTYTARIISALGQTVKTFDGAAPRAVRAAVNRANQQILQVEPVPPVTEIDKLKNKLHATGGGVGVGISPRDAKLIYGISDVNNATPVEFAQLVKKIKDKCVDMLKKLPVNNVIEIARGILFRFAPSVTIPYYIPDQPPVYYRYEFTQSFSVPTPRVKIPYEIAVSNKLVSAGGRKLIQTLVDKYEVEVGDVYMTVEKQRDVPALQVIVAIKTALNRDIVYTEFNTVLKKTYDRKLISYDNSYTVHEFNRSMNYNPHRVEQRLYLK